MLGEYNTARKMSKSINRTLNKTMSLFLALMLTVPMILASCAGSGSAGADKGFPEDPTVITKETAAYLMEQVSSPAPGSVGGDWLIKGLMDSGAEVPQSYYDLYYDNVRAEVKSKKGILSEDYYTEYERVIIGLSAIGKSTVVEGYDLAPYLDDYEKVSAQGVNASSYALIAARAAGITLENEDAYIQDILTQMSAESMEKDYAYADYIAIALEALSCYGDRPGVKEYIEKAVETLSSLQQEDGSYGNCESTAECIMALCSLGIDPVKDERFVKDGNSAADGLMVCYLGDGRFCHTPELPEADIMSSEKALLAAGAIRSFGSSNG